MSTLTKTENQQKFIARKYVAFFAMLGFLICAGAGGGAYALGIDLEKIPKVMNYDKPSDKEFAKASVKVEEKANSLSDSLS